ncbi:HbrB-like protein [Whalleya microplaca]|nr:HbrB-like protein [Whalleya microplaca]
MQPVRSQQRAPGSFSPLPGSVSSSAAAAAASSAAPARPAIRRIESSSSDDTISVPRTRGPQTPVTVSSPSFPNFPPSSNSSPQNFSRPTRPPSHDPPSARNASPLTLPPTRGHHVRKHSQTPGLFEPSLPSTSTSNLSQISINPPSAPSASLSASQIAAQAAMQHMQHQQHNRHRSQTVPFPGSDGHDATRRPGHKPPPGPRSPPMLSLTEASAPRDNGFGNQGYYNGLLGSHAANATAAANVVFPRTSPQSSPGLPTQESPVPPPLVIPEKPAKSEKSKVKLFSRPKKIETRGDPKEKPLPSPGKIGSALASLQRGNFSTTSLADAQSFYSLGNSSAATLRAVDTSAEGKEKEKERKHHFLSRQKHKLSAKDDYHLPLSSAASNSLPIDPHAPSSLYNFNLPPSPGPNNNIKSISGLDLRHGARVLRDKRKEDKHDVMRHDNESTFAVGNEWPGPGSLGSNANAPSYFEPVDPAKYGLNNLSLDDAWPYLKAKLLAIFEGEDLRLPVEDFNRIVTMHIQYCIQRRSAYIIVDDLRDLLSTGFASLDHMLRKTPEDRLIPTLVELWVFTFTSILPYMQAVFLPLDLEFSGTGPLLSPEQARDFWGGVPVSSSPAPGAYPAGPNSEAHLSPVSKVLDIRRFVLTAYRDAIILPRYEKLKTIFSRLSLEHLPSSLASLALASPPPLNDSLASLSTSPSDASASARPGTAMSLDPSVASYNSNSTTVFGNDSNPSRSRAISNVSYGSGASDPQSAGTGSMLRPFTPSQSQSQSQSQIRDSAGAGSLSGGLRGEILPIPPPLLGSLREQNVEDSKQVTDMVGRMLQCMSVLASVGTGTGADANGQGMGLQSGSSGSVSGSGSGSGSGSSSGIAAMAAGIGATGGSADEAGRMVSELGRLLKLNWLGRGRTGRNRRGMVGGRVKRHQHHDSNASASASASAGAGAGLGVGMLREGIREGVGVLG